MGTDDGPPLPARPEGSTIDLDRFVAVATWSNAAHAAMGTRLLGVERRAATIGLAWRADLAGSVGGGLAPGVLAALLDHACSLAVLMAVDDFERCGSTMGLRVDHLAPPTPGQAVEVRAECLGGSTRVAHVRAEVRHPLGPQLLAVGTATVAVRR